MEPVFRKRDGWRRIYIDLPGMGLTKNCHEISSSEDMLHAVAEFIRAVIPNEKYLIAGESYGGYIAGGMIEKEKEQIPWVQHLYVLLLSLMQMAERLGNIKS
ncbi:MULTISPECIES: alpha/beta fold hydrolase [Bacillus]|uniref:Alpha/beta hydrolase n=1 Tax=Bacillus glycinifermentans TaxID=1664069 RepID=A0AAJ3YZN5_9BACI|nr:MULTISPECIES: alpha/beta hydrolase [Bacillus]MDU0070775.1 alpha/beta hydrolase [Bacillus sp. IG6]MED8018652.1 alpha/beta hydrolase [Bacillus glycinifermentans]QAT66197.1 alpha/beta hydrolase [Bacillus glycinifermentans]WKB75905.1 alpha/beta hydrolase [Bacillus glycinifermentans]SCA86930.1 alpha/beta hydrolase [Bacillus glycinifermentans]